MPAKCGEVPERYCMHFPQIVFLSSPPLFQHRGLPSASQMARGTTLHAQRDFYGAGSAREQDVNQFPELSLRAPTVITISVIEGFSKGLAYQMNKSCITVGRIGGGADFEFDDPEASDVHCIVAVRQDGVRIYDGVSTTGIYVDDQRISTVELRNMSTFRLGSSLFLVSVLPNCRWVEID